MPPRASAARLLHHIRRLAAPPSTSAGSDADLLTRFLAGRDPAAFEAIVARYGPMVLRLCRRLVGDAHIAEDCFQATFLVLARRAASVRRPASLAAWLYGVAARVGRKARDAGRRRSARELPAVEGAIDPRPDPLNLMTARELLAAQDEEVWRLPEVYRLPVLLCCLEGKTREEAARILGWTEGSVKGRLERGRARLHSRLLRRGLTLTAVLGIAELSRDAASAAAPAGLTSLTASAATRFAAGKAAAGAVPARAAALVETVMKGMTMTRLKIASVLLLAFLAAGSGAGVLLQSAWAQPPAGLTPAQPPPQAPAAKEDHLKDTLAALDKSLWDALARGDVEPVRKLYGDDFVSFSERGRYGKKDAEESVRLFRGSDLKVRDVELVRVSKDAAILTYVYSVKLSSPAGQPEATWTDHRTSRCWAQRDGGWVLVFGQDQTLPGGQ